MKNPIQFIDDDDFPGNSDFNDWEEGDYPPDNDDEYWVRGKKRVTCPMCIGIGCPSCEDLGYTTTKNNR